MKHKLFSYGTLQLNKVQLESFGRLLQGEKEILAGYILQQLEITNEEVLSKSQQTYHPIAIKTNNPADKVHGIIFEISEVELIESDKYEVSEYKRVLETFESGIQAWVYVSAAK